MKPKELTDLEALARSVIVVSGSGGWYDPEALQESAIDNALDAAFIAAASPEAVLTLIEQAKQANGKPHKAK